MPYFNDKFKRQFKQCKKVVQAVNNRQASREVTDLLVYKSIYQHTIPHKSDELGRISLSTLHIKGRALQHETFSLERSGAKLHSHLPLPVFKVGKRASLQARRATLLWIPLTAKRMKEKKLLGSLCSPRQPSASASCSSNPSNGGCGDGGWSEFLEGSDSSKRKGKETTAGPSKRSKRRTRETSLTLHPSSSANAKLWKPEFSIVDLGKEVTVADFAKDCDTILALAWAIMLPKDVADLEDDGFDTIKDLLVMQQV
ncbi:hypothetical protein Acr_07g0010550 [Actinidia rufa]|uniref:Uncharacterized protein n=1 Tax=Actinidia rufa TaxID=165716 RepID=A0A7J0EY25_9ERIC|nr:hypothetical protein Acr_07g0010550 [Actinidia rufa]